MLRRLLFFRFFLILAAACSQELATAAEGLVFQLSDSPDPLELQRIAAKLAESIQVSITKGSTVPLTV